MGPDPHAVVGELAAEGWLVGPIVPDGPAAGAVLVATTERRTAAQVEGPADTLHRALRERAAKPWDAPGPDYDPLAEARERTPAAAAARAEEAWDTGLPRYQLRKLQEMDPAFAARIAGRWAEELLAEFVRPDGS